MESQHSPGDPPEPSLGYPESPITQVLCYSISTISTSLLPQTLHPTITSSYIPTRHQRQHLQLRPKDVVEPVVSSSISSSVSNSVSIAVATSVSVSVSIGVSSAVSSSVSNSARSALLAVSSGSSAVAANLAAVSTSSAAVAASLEAVSSSSAAAVASLSVSSSAALSALSASAQSAVQSAQALAQASLANASTSAADALASQSSSLVSSASGAVAAASAGATVFSAQQPSSDNGAEILTPGQLAAIIVVAVIGSSILSVFITIFALRYYRLRKASAPRDSDPYGKSKRFRRLDDSNAGPADPEGGDVTTKEKPVPVQRRPTTLRKPQPGGRVSMPLDMKLSMSERADSNVRRPEPARTKSKKRHILSDTVPGPPPTAPLPALSPPRALRNVGVFEPEGPPGAETAGFGIGAFFEDSDNDTQGTYEQSPVKMQLARRQSINGGQRVQLVRVNSNRSQQETWPPWATGLKEDKREKGKEREDLAKDGPPTTPTKSPRRPGGSSSAGPYRNRPLPTLPPLASPRTARGSHIAAQLMSPSATADTMSPSAPSSSMRAVTTPLSRGRAAVPPSPYGEGRPLTSTSRSEAADFAGSPSVLSPGSAAATFSLFPRVQDSGPSTNEDVRRMLDTARQMRRPGTAPRASEGVSSYRSSQDPDGGSALLDWAA